MRGGEQRGHGAPVAGLGQGRLGERAGRRLGQGEPTGHRLREGKGPGHGRVDRRGAGRVPPAGAVLGERGRPAVRAAEPVPPGMRGRTAASVELRALGHADSTTRRSGRDAVRWQENPIGAPSSRAASRSESCADARACETGRAGPVPPRVLRAPPDPNARVLTASTLGASGVESRPQTCKLQRFHSVGRDRTGESDAAQSHAAPSAQFSGFQPPVR
ncbi:Uncharacterised protein [Amycolatopsis camponoti]|uniref:Uncharacterized protein n=1 Tax=Amycolatopsis camponoti TaxID=2606593 RepID=A0A6I8M9P1_9PSEU|nr:Uncharacterised protein [Amycolatopsis camponoti]